MNDPIIPGSTPEEIEEERRRLKRTNRIAVTKVGEMSKKLSGLEDFHKELESKIVDAITNVGLDDIDPADLVITFGPGSTPTILNDDHSAEVLVRFHVRQKSEEEKLHDRADKIIERHLGEPVGARAKKQVICISCGDPIRPDQNILSTIHGAYHGAPMNCVEGR